MTEWLSDLVARGFDDPAGVIVDASAEELAVGAEKAGKITLRFRVRDMRGDPYVATAKVFVPAAFGHGRDERLPAWFNCGYELADAMAERYLRKGWAVVSPCDPADGEVFPLSNPLLRGPNTDFVLAHLARGATFLDPTAIVYGGGSAGGYATLMVVAEAFPAAVALPNCPPVNLGYQAAYSSTVFPRIVANPPEEHPVVTMITGAFCQWIDPWKEAYGPDYGAESWFEHSPVAHVDRITCPVASMSSTADFLVPVEQVGREFAEPTLASPPRYVTLAADELVDSPRVAARLLDVLGDRADVRVVPVPEGAASMEVLDLTLQLPQMHVPLASAPAEGKQWLVNILDEGPIIIGPMHTRHAVEPDFEPFMHTALSNGLSVDQLTAAKLDQLLARYEGEEWLAGGYVHLDDPVAERADVERGLALYCAQSPRHAARFAQLYEAAEPGRKILPIELVSRLSSQPD